MTVVKVGKVETMIIQRTSHDQRDEIVTIPCTINSNSPTTRMRNLFRYLVESTVLNNIAQ